MSYLLEISYLATHFWKQWGRELGHPLTFKKTPKTASPSGCFTAFPKSPYVVFQWTKWSCHRDKPQAVMTYRRRDTDYPQWALLIAKGPNKVGNFKYKPFSHFISNYPLFSKWFYQQGAAYSERRHNSVSKFIWKQGPPTWIHSLCTNTVLGSSKVFTVWLVTSQKRQVISKVFC